MQRERQRRASLRIFSRAFEKNGSGESRSGEARAGAVGRAELSGGGKEWDAGGDPTGSREREYAENPTKGAMSAKREEEEPLARLLHDSSIWAV